MKKKLKVRLNSITYMQTSLGLFIVSLLLLLALFIRAVLSGGQLQRPEALMGLCGMLMALGGFILPLYGKFVVESRDKPDYRLGMLLNGILFLIYVFFYFLGF